MTNSENNDLTQKAILQKIKGAILSIAKKNNRTLDFSKNLFSSGQLSSIMAVEILLALEKEFGIKASVTFQSIQELDNIQTICYKILELKKEEK